MRSSRIGMTRLAAATLPLALGLIWVPATAQAEVAAAPADDSGDAAANGEIVVTARRRAEDPQKVPIAITTFGGASLERANVYNIDLLQRQAPSLQVIGNNPRNTNINIRGLGSNIGFVSDGLENGVGVYIDDVYYSRTGQALFDLYDVQRIELLRGPQGTLFGKNSTAGALSIYTTAPEFHLGAGANLSVGSLGYRQQQGFVNVPVVDDRLAARVSVTNTARDGMVRNTFTGKRSNAYDSLSVRGQILAKPTDDITLRVSGDYGRQDYAGLIGSVTGLLTTRIDGSPLPNGFVARAARLGYTLPTIDPFGHDVDADVSARVKMKQSGVSGKLDWTLPGHVLSIITAYRRWSWNPANDIDGTSLPVFTVGSTNSRQRQFTQEIRLASSGEHRLDYVLGAFYFRQTLRSQLLTQYGSAAPAFILGAANPVTIAALSGFGVEGHSALKTDSYAGFGQATWHATSKLSATVGLRYTHERKRGTFDQAPFSGADLTSLPAAIAGPAQAIRNGFGPVNAFAVRRSEGNVSGQANIAYQFTPTLLGYATYARGFKSGGVTLNNVAPGIPVTVSPEHADTYEIGVKSTLLDGHATVNAAAFWNDVDNYQASLLDPVRTATYVSNVGKVRTRGIELEGTYKPTRDLNLYASGTFNDARYRSYVNAPCPIEYIGLKASCDLSGRKLAGVSRWAGSAGGEYARDLGPANLQGYVGADYSYRSAINYSSNLAAATRIPGYSLVNARIGIRSGDGHFDVSVWARNLFDKGYLVSHQVGAFNTGVLVGILGEPRIVGGTVRTRF